MKLFFKSDYFKYVHPEHSPCGISDYSKKDLKIAEENTEKFHINEELLDTAIYESDDTIDPRQKGTILLFPEIPPSDMYIMDEFIKKVFSKAEAELGETYNEPSDPTIFWETGMEGRHFSGMTINKKTRETFGRYSPSIYIAGCTDNTAQYLIETAVDMMYNESRKHDRKVSKRGEGVAVAFERFKSFLVYHVGSHRFYQLSSHDSNVWYRPDRSVGKRDFIIYDSSFVDGI